MTDPLFHDFLVGRAKFPYPDCPIGASASSTGLSEVDIGLLDNQWKARHAVRDNDLANKLCGSLRTILGGMTVTEDLRNFLLRWFPLAVNKQGMKEMVWSNNPSEAKSSMLLVLGVFNATPHCLWQYDQCTFDILPKQKAEVAKSIVDFHVLVDGKLVALVEAKSPTIMNKLGESLPQNGFKIRWTAGSTNLVSLVFSKAALCLGLRKKEWLFLTCHNHWIVIRLVTRDNAPPFLAFSPLITMDDSSVPFRAFLGAILSVVKGGAVEASVFDDPQTLNTIEDEAPGEEGFPSPGSDGEDGSGEYRGPSGEGSTGRHPATCGHPTQDSLNLTVSSSSPLSPSSQVLIRVHPLPNNTFGLPPIPHTGKQCLWLTRSLGHGSTGSVYKCHFDNFEKPFAVKVIEMLRSSDIKAQKRLRNEFDVYITMEKAYQSGKLQNRIAPRCYGAFEGKYIDVLILDLHNAVRDSWDDFKLEERLEIFKLVYDLHSLGITHGDLEPRNVVRTDSGKFLLIDFTHSSQHRSEHCVIQRMTESMGDSIPLKGYKCDELNMFGKLMGG